MGTVIALAPEHVIENDQAARQGRRRPRRSGASGRKKPPPGMVSWGQPTFDRLVAAPPEPLTSSFTVSHSMLLNVLDRPGDGRAALGQPARRQLRARGRAAPRTSRRADEIVSRPSLDAGVVEELDEPDEHGRTVRVTIDLQADFALNQPLAPFALAALDLLDPASPTHALDVVSVIESVLDDPRQILSAQLLQGPGRGRRRDEGRRARVRRAHGRARPGRRTRKPLAELLEPMFEVYRQSHPWVADHPLRPKSVARDLYERAMDFTDYVRFYELARSEGIVLRYLSDAYKTLVQHRARARQDRGADRHHRVARRARPPGRLQPARRVGGAHPPHRRRGRAARRRAATAGHGQPPRVHACWSATRSSSRVELAARKRWFALGELDADDGWTADRWSEALVPYFAEHGSLGIGPEARSPAMLLVEEHADRWDVRQILDDPDAEHAWAITAVVDLPASVEAGTAVVRIVDVAGP